MRGAVRSVPEKLNYSAMLLTRSVVVAVIAAVATGQDYEDRPDYRGYQGPLNLCQDRKLFRFSEAKNEIGGIRVQYCSMVSLFFLFVTVRALMLVIFMALFRLCV